MRLREVRDLISVRRPQLHRVDRTLARCVTIEDLRREACRRWPRGVRGYVEGGADAEISLRRNRAAFEAYSLVPSVLRDVEKVDLSANILGVRSALPLALGPTGYTRMMHPAGEYAAASAARAAGIPYTLTTMATMSIEQVAPAGGDLWFQLYMWRDRGLVRELLQRAQAAGYRALVLTVDTAVTGLRVRDLHNGFTLPPRLSPASLLDMARHPAWCLGLLRGQPITFANFADEVSGRSENIMEFAARQFDPTVNWTDLEWLRGQWPGPIVLKGLADAADAVRARDAGIDALSLSNHGGRQLDQAVPPIEVLPEIREAVGPAMPVFVDSGVRHGSDVALALARGADGCLIGRPYLYGLGAAGEAGCAAAIRMLGDELRRVMRLLGVVSVAEFRERGNELVRRAA
jgi:L-lactate dehydrogenase (cytochrome)